MSLSTHTSHSKGVARNCAAIRLRTSDTCEHSDIKRPSAHGIARYTLVGLIKSGFMDLLSSISERPAKTRSIPSCKRQTPTHTQTAHQKSHPRQTPDPPQNRSGD